VELEVREGDIAAVEADAVANAANDRLWMGASVAGALKRAGGDAIEQEAMARRRGRSRSGARSLPTAAACPRAG
jgi:O-acetyl-ADP-ribose deacetylase (regulator of RNase III)